VKTLIWLVVIYFALNYVLSQYALSKNESLYQAGYDVGSSIRAQIGVWVGAL
jgi:hypothetical protein